MSVRLRQEVTPTAYDLTLSLDPDLPTFRGRQVIHLARTSSSADGVTLHIGDGITIEAVDGATLVGRDAATQTVHFSAVKDAITVTYTGTHQLDMKGLYRSTYHVDGVEHKMISTHFEPTSARHCYICLDEPAARAAFTLTVEVPSKYAKYQAFSNGPLRSHHVVGDTAVFSFHSVPHIPPYLTAVVVGELACVERRCGQRHTPVRFWATPDKAAKLHFGLEVATFSLEFFEKFFQAPYQLPKLDLIAIPDFPIGGMENWGCTLLVESVLLDAKASSVSSLKSAAELIAHEVSHNWFGNSVGIDWWEGLWLKEGFASWCGYFAVIHFRPEWHAEVDVLDEIFDALHVDAHRATHAVDVEVKNPADITQIFDAISYQKGMSIVRMLEDHLGAKPFSDALASYVKTYTNKNTTSHQLWAALEESSGIPVVSIVEGFTKQEGHPIVAINRVAPTRVALSQRRYSHFGVQLPKLLWNAPVQLLASNGCRHRCVLTTESTEIDLPAEFAHASWIKVNPSHSAFYHTQYSDELFAEILSNIALLSPNDRCGFQNDALRLFASGCLDVALIIRLFAAYKNERALEVLFSYVPNVENFVGLFKDENVKQKLFSIAFTEMAAFAHELLQGIPSELSDVAPLLRPIVIRAALRITSGPSVDKIRVWCLHEAASYLGSKLISDPNLLSIVLDEVAKTDGAGIREKLWSMFLESDADADLSRKLLAALCAVPNDAFVGTMLNRAISCDLIRSQYGGVVFHALSRNSSCSHLVWPTMKERYDDVMKQWGKGQFRIQRIVHAVGNTLSGSLESQDFAAFFRAHPCPNAKLSVEREIESITTRGALADRWEGVVAQ